MMRYTTKKVEQLSKELKINESGTIGECFSG